MKIWREKDKALNSWIWKADFWYRKKKYRPVAFTKENLNGEILRLKAEADEAARGVKKITVSVAELVAARVGGFDPKNRTENFVKNKLEIFLEVCGRELLVTDVTKRHYLEYLKECVARSGKKRLSGQTKNQYLSFVSAMLNRAEEYFPELEDYNPPKVPRVRAPSAARDRLITEDEKRALLDYLRFEGNHEIASGSKHGKKHVRREADEWRAVRLEYADMFETALLTAMRWGEIKLLRWSYIDYRARTVYLPAEITKTRAARTVYLNSRAVEILRERQKLSKSVFVFPDPENPELPRKYYYKGIRKICARLNLPFSRDGFTLHTTRHTAVSEILERTGDFAAAQAQAGHSDRTMTARYAHVRRDKMLEVVESLVEK